MLYSASNVKRENALAEMCLVNSSARCFNCGHNCMSSNDGKNYGDDILCGTVVIIMLPYCESGFYYPVTRDLSLLLLLLAAGDDDDNDDDECSYLL